MKHIYARPLAAGLLALLVAGGLAGCAAAVVGGAAGAGTLLMSADRRSGQTQEDDRSIEAAANDQVVQALAGRGHVNLNSYFRKVLITGEVPSEQDRRLVEDQVRAVSGVAAVVNELAVMPAASAWQRSTDGLTTSKVRTRLMNQNGVPSGSIRVVTARGTTYLMGRLTRTETELATAVTRQTDGVQRVVRVIDLIADPMGAGGTATSGAAAADPAVTAPAVGDASDGVVTSPVTQPVIESARPPVQVQSLPPMK